MGWEHKIPAERADSLGAESCHDGDKAVDDDRDPEDGSAEKNTAHGRQVQAADLCQNIDDVRHPVSLRGAIRSFPPKGILTGAPLRVQPVEF